MRNPILEEIERRGMSIADASIALGISYPSLYAALKGKGRRRPSYEMIMKVSKEWGLDIATLVEHYARTGHENAN